MKNVYASIYSIKTPGHALAYETGPLEICARHPERPTMICHIDVDPDLYGDIEFFVVGAIVTTHGVLVLDHISQDIAKGAGYGDVISIPATWHIADLTRPMYLPAHVDRLM